MDIKTIKNNRKVESWIINGRYQIYSDDGTVYDTIKAVDIPQYIFKLKDFLIKEDKS
jgi:hypothetical protein